MGSVLHWMITLRTATDTNTGTETGVRRLDIAVRWGRMYMIAIVWPRRMPTAAPEQVTPHPTPHTPQPHPTAHGRRRLEVMIEP